jgi:hypothetical protein
MIRLNLQISQQHSTPDPVGEKHATTASNPPISAQDLTPGPQPVLSRIPLATEIPGVAYIRASQQLQINEIPLALAELEQVLREETLGIYDYAKVAAYLDEQCRQLEEKRKPGEFHSYEWRWHPIREYWSVYSWLPKQSNEVYNKPIPPEAFPTIERILSHYPEALFYVSDIRNFQDPFLAVTVKGADKMHVIERWDEPSFRG